MKTYRGDFYFPSRDAAQKYAASNGWSTDRIIEYVRGWAIQLYPSGPYVGPEEIEKRSR